mmetsp:Transcript_10131/g.14858  ORF Transcript_10131/g.14858 Transcript_10131/m.14858 type:complete len:176 (-) Transcript_10131:227-754(-)
MGRECASCGDWLSNSNFSRNQKLKGPGYSRCKDCVLGIVSYQCHECHRTFDSSNELNMHMQIHRQRNVSCPVCKQTRFRSGANAMQHVESGYCKGCNGKDNARQQIFEFVSRNRDFSNRFMTQTPMLTNGNNRSSNGEVPDKPYHCPDCNKSFQQVSQLMQHQDNKHRNQHMLTF